MLAGGGTNGRFQRRREGTRRYSIKCAFLSGQNVAHLQAGAKVTVRGRCAGTHKSLILLEDCIIGP
jgi:hypothetical protein